MTLHAFDYINLVQMALDEDLGGIGDITTQATIEKSTQATAQLVARQSGVLAGMEVAAHAFKSFNLDATVNVEPAKYDGDVLAAGDTLATITGSARAILTAERTALNFLNHLSGIATLTRETVDKIKHTKAKLLDTRKTTPGFRRLEKHAVSVGGGTNHRLGLFDEVLVKDNHIAACGGVKTAVEKVKETVDPALTIVVEVDTLDQLKELLELKVDRVLLDNMSTDDLSTAVAMVNGKIETEASGGVNPSTIVSIAETGVNYISAGFLTHSAPTFDIGLDFQTKTQVSPLPLEGE